MTKAKAPIRLLDLFTYYRGLPHQMASLAQLEESLPPGTLSRDTEWFRTWSQAGKQPDEPAWMAPARAIIKEFEGYKGEAYQDGAGHWTVGYGTRFVHGTEVGPGDKVSPQLAEELLTASLKQMHAELVKLIPSARHYGAAQTAALLSWMYNVGPGAVRESTLRRRLNLNEGAMVVVPQELPRWNRVNSTVSEGLTRRRAAEVALFTGSAAAAPPKPAAQQSAAKLTPKSPFTALLTPHIQIGEFALFKEERRFDYQYQIDIATELATFLEHLRAKFGGNPIIITSGYRPASINKAVGGASGSEHLFKKGEGAVDFLIEGVNIYDVQKYCDDKWPCSLGYGAPRGFVHLGIRTGRPRVRWDY